MYLEFFFRHLTMRRLTQIFFIEISLIQWKPFEAARLHKDIDIAHNYSQFLNFSLIKSTEIYYYFFNSVNGRS